MLLEVWMQKEELPNQKCSVAMMRAMVDLDPLLGIQKHEILMKVLKWCFIVGFHLQYPDLWAAVLNHFEVVLDRSWVLMKCKGIGQATWWSKVEDFAGIILDVAAWNACIKCVSDWTLVKPQLEVVMMSLVGQRMFAVAWRTIINNEVTHIIDRNLVTNLTPI